MDPVFPAKRRRGPRSSQPGRHPGRAPLPGRSSQGERRRGVPMCAAVVLAWVLIFGAYAALLIARESGLCAFTRLGLDIAPIGAELAWQIRRSSTARLTELRAVGRLALLSPCSWPCSLLHLPRHVHKGTWFTERLDHIRARYLTFGVISIVGFGHIAALTVTARLVVTAQMLIGLTIIGAVIGAFVRLIFAPARSRVILPDESADG